MKNDNNSNRSSVFAGVFSSLAQLQVKSQKLNLREMVAEARCSAYGAEQTYARISWAFAQKSSCITAFVAVVKRPTQKGIATKIVRMDNSGSVTEEWLDKSGPPEIEFDGCGGMISRGVILTAIGDDGEQCHSFSVRKKGKLVALHHRPCLISDQPIEAWAAFFGLELFSEPKITEQWKRGDYSSAEFIAEELDLQNVGNDEGVFEYVSEMISHELKARRTATAGKSAEAKIEEAILAGAAEFKELTGDLKQVVETAVADEVAAQVAKPT